MGSALFPRVDDERVVLFFNRWRTADGFFVGPRDLAALFIKPASAPGTRRHKGTTSLFRPAGTSARNDALRNDAVSDPPNTTRPLGGDALKLRRAQRLADMRSQNGLARVS
jgi:hypothetical protein